MIELMRTSKDSMAQSYAGDVYNTAVYLKRAFADVNVGIMSAVGEDALSLDMIERFGSESINSELVFKSDTRNAGMYLIQTDDEGERTFTYWRENSAARTVMAYVDKYVTAELSQSDVFFFSGISLAVIEPQDRDALWSLISTLKANGVQIIFDPNYRARMWSTPAEAKLQFEKAFRLSDMVLPGIDDFAQLYGIDTFEGIIEFCQPFEISELVIKNGPEGVRVITANQSENFAIQAVDNVVDTTSAGDSFNGLYVGARLQGLDIAQAVHLASKAAAVVIQHRGAIVPSADFSAAFIQQYM